MKIYKTILLSSMMFLSFSCAKKEGSSPQSEPQNPVPMEDPGKPLPPPPPSSASSIEIYNFNGKFGEVLLLNKARFNLILNNPTNQDIKINHIYFTNSTFKFDLPYPGISSASTKLGSDLPCGKNLDKNKRCVFSVTFQPISEKVEVAKIIIDFSIDSIKKKYKFDISGVGKDKSPALKALEKLKNTFSKVTKKAFPTPTSEKIIESVLAKGHSNKYVYDDFFDSFKTKGVDVLKKQLSVKRVIGYTYRADSRAIETPWGSCDSDWKYGFTLTDPISNKTIDYPAHSVGSSCGIKDVGGFFPTFTRKKDIEKINQMLIDYKKSTGKDFDPSTDNFSILNKNPTSPGYVSSISDQLNWWLQSVLNLSGHVHNDYDYKGFISTSTSINFIKKWGGGSYKTVYVVYQEGGYELPKTSDPTFNLGGGGHMTMENEYEITVPGAILWEDVMAYVTVPAKEIMVRDGFEAMDKNAYDAIINALSHI